MSALPWFKCNPRDFLDGMVSLTPEERGTYFTLVCLMYARGGPIPDEPRWLAGQLLVSVRAWSSLRAALIVKGKLYVAECGGLANERAISELEKSAKVQRKPGEKSAKSRGKTAENEADFKEIKDIAFAVGAGAALEKTPLDTDTETDKEKVGGVVARAAWDRPRLDELQAQLREAAGGSIGCSPNLLKLSDVIALLEPTSGEPCDLFLDVLPAIQAAASTVRPGSVGSWAFFRRCIIEARDRRLAGAPQVQDLTHDRQPAHAHGPRPSTREAGRSVWAAIAAEEAAERAGRGE